MDLQKAKIFLEKINREFARMARDPENVARIDVDIICAYTREMYDAFLSEKNTTVPVPAATPEPALRPTTTAPPVEFSPERPAVRPAATRREPAVVAPPSPPEPAPIYVAPPPPAPLPPEPAPVYVAPPAPKPEPAPVYVAPPPPAPKPEPAPVYVAPPPPPVHRPHFNPDAEALFEEKKAREHSEKLAQTRIADLSRGAISVNDRLLFANQLFGGNGNLLNETLAALNHCSGFAEAKDYLLQHCVERFQWADKGRQEFAKNFIQLVRRRFN